MKILMLTTDHIVIDRRILQEAKSLIAAGHQVTLLAGFECQAKESFYKDNIKIERFVYDGSDPRFVNLMKKLRIKYSKFYLLLWKVFKLYARFIAKKSCFENYIYEESIKHDFDILHVHDFPLLNVGVQLARERKVKLIYDAHEIYWAQVFLPKKIQFLYKRQEKKLINIPDAVITVNPFIAEHMSKIYNIPAPKVILNAEESKAVIDRKLLRRELNISDEKRVILYQGWIAHSRGIENLIKLMPIMDEHYLLVVIGYGDHLQKLKSLAHDLNCSHKIKFYGKCEPEHLFDVTCGADIGIIPYFGVDPNNYYCSPNKLFEYINAELPIISNPLPYLKSVVETNKLGLTVEIDQPKALKIAIDDIYNSHQYYIDNVKLAKENLNWERESEKLFEIYRALSC